ncbi:hypothetical protein [Roseimicrobium sp. ORNL1]|uniref:hypothetical protein n=1 Tax=Roseimicrobium sp. ORNL1 TaxID=2711231 RepID=UPI0013E12A13|nr:hypothetical protein [Roseimicrobium sp. ORNL1]QIF02056.1 hypothetical protein G5S37_11105 [Roseimicrobium sp. ORNL1]
MSRSSILQRHLRLATTLLLLVLGGMWISAPVATMAQKPTAEGKKEGKGKGKAKAEDGEKPKEAAASAATAQGPAVPTTGLYAFGKMLPLGQAHRDMEIPSFKNGAPSSMLQAKTMTRTDEENMFLEQMNIWMYGPPGEADKDLRVQLRTAIYHMPSNIIASEERSRITRSDFDLQGDSLIFDTASGQGKMVGNVTMVLHDASSLTKAASGTGEPPATGTKEGTEKTKKEETEKDSTSWSAPPSSSPAGSAPAPAATTPATATAVKPGAGASPTKPKK